jgi:hypothetical protein
MLCDECGIELPLRDGATDEQWEPFRCANCGFEYRAVFDENARSTVRFNALATGPTAFREVTQSEFGHDG